MLAIRFHRWIHTEADQLADIGHGEDIDVACFPSLNVRYSMLHQCTGLNVFCLHPKPILDSKVRRHGATIAGTCSLRGEHLLVNSCLMISEDLESKSRAQNVEYTTRRGRTCLQ